MDEPKRFPYPIAGGERPKPLRVTKQQRIAALVAMTPVERGEHLARCPGDLELVRRINDDERKSAKRARTLFANAQRKAVAEQNRAQLEREERELRAGEAELPAGKPATNAGEVYVVAPTIERAKRYAREVLRTSGLNMVPTGDVAALRELRGARVIALAFNLMRPELRHAVLAAQVDNTVEIRS